MRLIVVITCLLVQSLVVWVCLWLHPDISGGLLGSGVCGRSRSRRSGLEHGGVLDERLGNVARAVRGAIILVLGVRMSVVVGERRGILLRSLSGSGLGLVRGLRTVLLRSLSTGGGKVGVRRLLGRHPLALIMAKGVAPAEGRLLSVRVVEGLQSLETK